MVGIDRDPRSVVPVVVPAYVVGSDDLMSDKVEDLSNAEIVWELAARARIMKMAARRPFSFRSDIRYASDRIITLATELKRRMPDGL